MKIVYFTISIVFLICGCDNTSEQQVEESNSSNKSELLGPNDALLYSVPAPVFVSTVLKSYGNIYDDKLLNDTKDIEPQVGLSSDQTINLGINIVDFSYTYIFDQKQMSLKYLAKLDKIMNDMNLQSPELTKAMIRLRENININDSVKKIVSDYQSKLGNYFINEDREALGLYMLSGMYVEGLYLTLGSYNNIINSKKTINYNDDRFAQLLLQEETQLTNLLDLWKDKNHPDASKIIEKLSALKVEFDSLKISYGTHQKSNKIIRINFERSKLDKMLELTTIIRKQLVK